MQHITNNQVFLLLILLSYADSPFFPVTVCYINQHSKKLAQCQFFLFYSINTFLVFSDSSRYKSWTLYAIPMLSLYTSKSFLNLTITFAARLCLATAWTLNGEIPKLSRLGFNLSKVYIHLHQLLTHYLIQILPFHCHFLFHPY